MAFPATLTPSRAPFLPHRLPSYLLNFKISRKINAAGISTTMPASWAGYRWLAPPKRAIVMSRRTVRSRSLAAPLLAPTAFVAGSDTAVPLAPAWRWYADPGGAAAYASGPAVSLSQPPAAATHLPWSGRLGQPAVWL